jgi:glycerophosphoryl diester phosphodiesterase
VWGRATVQVEIKLRADKTRYSGIEEAVLAALRDAHMVDHAVIISFDFPTLAAVKSIEPKAATAALFSRAFAHRADVSDSAAIADELWALGVDFAGVAKSFLDEELYDALRSRNLGVGVWTVDDESDMRRFISMGVDFITSNRPDLLMRVLGR